MNITDQLNFSNHEPVQRLAFSILNQLQDQPGGQQVAASGLLFLLMCERFKADPRDALDKASRMLLDALSYGRGEQVRAIKQYLEHEL